MLARGRRQEGGRRPGRMLTAKPGIGAGRGDTLRDGCINVALGLSYSGGNTLRTSQNALSNGHSWKGEIAFKMSGRWGGGNE